VIRIPKGGRRQVGKGGGETSPEIRMLIAVFQKPPRFPGRKRKKKKKTKTAKILDRGERGGGGRGETF